MKNWKKKRTIEIFRRVAVTCTFSIMLCIIAVQATKIAKADTLEYHTEKEEKVKIFHLHEIQYQEKLEDIAELYCDYSIYKTSQEYIQEVKKINQDMNLQYSPGDQIIVPVYVETSELLGK